MDFVVPFWLKPCSSATFTSFSFRVACASPVALAAGAEAQLELYLQLARGGGFWFFELYRLPFLAGIGYFVLL